VHYIPISPKQKNGCKLFELASSSKNKRKRSTQ